MALSAADLQAFHAVQLPTAAKAAPAAKGNFLTHLFPTVGGIVGGVGGGALGGAAAGTAILPGIGTAAGGLIGALLGGAAGGAGGKVAENKVEDKGLGSGVVQQALEQGVLSAGPLRLLKAGKGAAAAIGGVKTIATEAEPSLIGALTGVTHVPVAFDEGGNIVNAGSPKAVTMSHTLVNPTVGQLADAANDAAAKGFSTTAEMGQKAVGGQDLTPGAPALLEKTPGAQPVVSITGKKVQIPVSTVEGATKTVQPTVAGVVKHEIPGEGTQTVKNSLADIINAAGDASAKSSKGLGLLGKSRNAIATKGQQLESRAGGFGVGEKASGGVQLGVHDSAAIGDLLKTEGIKPGSPETRLAQVEDKLDGIGQQIDSHLNANNVTLNPADTKKITSDFLGQVDKQAGNTPGVQKWAQNYANNFENQVKDAKGLVDFRRQLDKQVINFNQNPQGALVDKQLAARAFRNVLSGATEKLAPGIGDLNKSYSGLTDAAEFLKGGAKAVSDQSQGGGGVVSRLLTNDTAQAAKSHTGALLQKAGSASEGVAKPFGLKAVTARSLPAGLVQAISNSNMITPTTPTTGNNSLIASINPNNSNISNLSQNNDDLSSGAQSDSPFAPANIEANIQKMVAAGASIDDVAKYVSLASSISSLQQSAAKSSSGTQLSGTQAQQADNATSGLQSLQTIAQSLSQNPNIAKEADLPGGSLASRLTGTGSYKAAVANAADVIGRLRSGGAISADEQKTFMGLLPAAFDSQQTANYKLNQLASLFQSFAAPAQGAQ